MRAVDVWQKKNALELPNSRRRGEKATHGVERCTAMVTYVFLDLLVCDLYSVMVSQCQQWEDGGRGESM
jgi:hypothetical protein